MHPKTESPSALQSNERAAPKRTGNALSSAALRGMVCAAVLAVMPAASQAQQACEMVTLKTPALKLEQMYAMAVERAKKWNADVALADLGNTSTGPLRPDGSSEAWDVKFYSQSANATIAINTFHSMLNCFALPGSAGRMPDLREGFPVDGAKMYAIAKQHGAKEIAAGYDVSIQMAATLEKRHAKWYVTFNKESGTAERTIIVDANTGEVEKVLP